MNPNTSLNHEKSVKPEVLTAAAPVRDRRRTARLGLPVDDELSASLQSLEDMLLALIDLVADARTAADTAGRLAALVDPERSHAIQPVVGQTEVVPLAFPCIRRRDVDELVAATSTAIATNAPDDVAGTFAEVATALCPWRTDDRQADAGAQLRSEITRALAVIQVDHGDDLDGLAQLDRRSLSDGTAALSRVRRAWCSRSRRRLPTAGSSIDAWPPGGPATPWPASSTRDSDDVR